MANCWFLRALPDDQLVHINAVSRGGISLRTLGTANVSPFLSALPGKRDVLLPGQLPSDIPDVIFNEISDPETHVARLTWCEEALATYDCPILNRPQAILQTTRHVVAEKLAGIDGLRVPRTVRCQPRSPRDVLSVADQMSIDFPFLIRECTSHGGQDLLRICSQTDAELLHRFAFDGRSFYISEFVDARDADGLYRKHRIVLVDGQPFLRHMIISKDWIVHASAASLMETRREWLMEERKTLSNFSARTAGDLGNVLATIHKRLGLDYFGIDCRIADDDTVTLFEANANMNVLLNTRKDKPAQADFITPITSALTTMVSSRANQGDGHNSALEYVARGRELMQTRELPKAIAAFNQAIKADSKCVTALREKSLALRLNGNYDQAAKSYQALARCRKNPLDDLAIASICPSVFASTDEMNDYGQRLTETLADYESRDLKFTLEDLTGTDAAPPFNLPFLHSTLRDWKAAYGRIFERGLDVKRPSHKNSGRPRIGFVVPPRHEPLFLRMLGGVLKKLANGPWTFTIICLDTGASLLKKYFHDTRAIDIIPVDTRFDAIIGTVRNLRCDVLFYRIVCDDLLSYLLPFYRLAPVQITSIGMQVTSGIPAMNYYLSSEVVEADDASTHYTEELIRFKSPVCYLERPKLGSVSKQRSDFGIRDDEHLYLCAQPHVGKLHPNFDEVIATILERDPHARLVQLCQPIARHRQALEHRWQQTLAPYRERITIQNQLPLKDYRALVSLADVILDAPYFTGVNTTYDALSFGKVIVTHTGDYQRARFTTACYHRMGLHTFAAPTLDTYIDIAVKLATDPIIRQRAEQAIQETSHSLFLDEGVVEEYRELFNRLTTESRE